MSSSPRMRLPVGAIVCLALAYSACTARAQMDDSHWATGFGLPGLNGRAYAALSLDDRIVVAGDFDRAGDVEARNVAAWDGRTWSAFDGGEELPGPVEELTLWRGHVVAAGFSCALSCSLICTYSCEGFVAVYMDDGWQITGVIDAPAFYGYIASIAAVGDTLYVAGEFDDVNGVPANGLVAWDGVTWGAVSSPDSSQARVLVNDGGTLVASWSRSAFAGRSFVSSWDGTAWHVLGDSLDTPPNCLLSTTKGLYAGTYAHPDSASALLLWDGRSWHSAAGPGAFYVQDLVDVGGRIVAHGSFRDSGGDYLHLAQVDTRGAWTAVADRDIDEWQAALGTLDGDLFVFGGMPTAGDCVVRGAARLRSGQWEPLGETGAGLPYVVNTFGHHAGRLLAGLSSNDPTPPLLQLTGGVWSTLDGASPYAAAGRFNSGGVVAAMAPHGTGLLAVGHLEIGDAYDTRCAALWDGERWQAVAPRGWFSPLCVTAYQGATVVGGRQGALGGLLTRLVRWDGFTWTSLDAIGNPYESINAMLAVGDTLLVGGAFSSVNGIEAHGIALFDGRSWTPLGGGMDGTVNALAYFRGRIVAGGSFSTAGGDSANSIAEWDGQRWRPLGRGVIREDGERGLVAALAIYHGDLIAAGSFTSAGDAAAGSVARWNGTSWAPFGSGVSGEVKALQVEGTSLFVGGVFQRAGAHASVNVARWDDDPAAAILLVPPLITLGSVGPSPSADRLDVTFSLEHDALVRVIVVDPAGRVVVTPAHENMVSGPHRVTMYLTTMFGERVANGVYWIRVEANGTSAARRFVLAR